MSDLRPGDRTGQNDQEQYPQPPQAPSMLSPEWHDTRPPAPQPAPVRYRQFGRLVWKGDGATFFFMTWGATILVVLTLGLAFPLVFYWQLKYFMQNLRIELT